MRPELETYHQIDRYFRNELYGKELIAFEERIKLDPDFALEVKVHGLVNQVVVGAAYEDLRLQMRKDLPIINHSNPFWLKWWPWGIALVVGIFFAWVSINNDTTSTTTLNITSPISKDKATKETSDQVVIAEQNQDEIVVKAKPSENTYSSPSAKPSTVEPNVSPTKEEPTVELKTIIPEKASLPAMDKKEIAIAHVHEEKPDCYLFQVPVEPEIMAACAGERNGRITFDLHNYHSKWKNISISKEKNAPPTTQTVFYNLAAGEHLFFIHDETGCNTSQKVTVPEKNCRPNEFAFNPELGETWKIPADPQETYSISIHSRGGLLVFKHHSKDGNINEWTGASQNMGHLEPGLYIYLIEYSDGRKESGQVSILK